MLNGECITLFTNRHLYIDFFKNLEKDITDANDLIAMITYSQ